MLHHSLRSLHPWRLWASVHRLPSSSLLPHPWIRRSIFLSSAMTNCWAMVMLLPMGWWTLNCCLFRLLLGRALLRPLLCFSHCRHSPSCMLRSATPIPAHRILHPLSHSFQLQPCNRLCPLSALRRSPPLALSYSCYSTVCHICMMQ